MTIAAERYEEQAKYEAIASLATLALDCKSSEKNAHCVATTTGKIGKATKPSVFLAGKTGRFSDRTLGFARLLRAGDAQRMPE